MEALGGTLAILGAVSIVAALVGGNVRLPGGVDFPALGNVALRWVLACVGSVFILAGLGLAFTSLEPTSQVSSTSEIGGSGEGSDGFTPPPSTSETPNTETTPNGLSAYQEKVNSSCAARSSEIRALPQPVDGDNEAIADAAFRYADIVTALASDLHSLEPPAPLKSSHGSLISSLQNLSSASSDLGIAARQNDSTAYDQAAETSRSFRMSASRFATQLGVAQCTFE